MNSDQHTGQWDPFQKELMYPTIGIVLVLVAYAFQFVMDHRTAALLFLALATPFMVKTLLDMTVYAFAEA